MKEETKMKILKKLIFIIIISFVFSLVCCSSKNKQTVDFYSLDTICTVTVYGKEQKNLLSISQKAVEKAEYLLFSDTPEENYISSKAEAIIILPNNSVNVFKKAFYITELTEGAFNMSIAPLVNLWDIKNRTIPPTCEEIDYALSLSGEDKISFDNGKISFKFPGNGIDIGAIGKGYAGDVIAKELTELDLDYGIINLGGNIRVFGQKPDNKPFSIGIRNPLSDISSDIVLTVSIYSGSVVTSGAYERYFEYHGKRYHHIIDPSTGYPSESDLLSVTILSEDGVYADALSTGCFVIGLEKSKNVLKKAIEKNLINGAIIIDENKKITIIGEIDTEIKNGGFSYAK